MSVVRQLAQAVLGVGLLGLAVRLFVAAVSDHQPVNSSPPPAGPDPGPTWVRDQTDGGVLPGGDVGGDAQLDELFSVRFWHCDQPGALVTYCFYAALNLDDLTSIYVEQQTELLVCTDPADPGSTEVWSDYSYAAVQHGFDSVKAATTAARHAAEAHLVCDEVWSGRPRWEADREGNP